MWKLLTVAILAMPVLSAQGADTLFYNDFGRATQILLSPTKVMIRTLDTSEIALQALMADFAGFDKSVPPVRLTENEFCVQAVKGIDVDSLLALVAADVRALAVGRGGIRGGGQEVFLTGSYALELEQGIDRDAILSKLGGQQFDLSWSWSNYRQLVFVKQIDKSYTNPRQALDSVNKMGGVRYFVPSLLLQVQLLASPSDTYWVNGMQSYLYSDKQNLEEAYDFCLQNDTVALYFFDDAVADHVDWPQPFSIIGRNFRWGIGPYMLTNYSYHGMAVAGVAYSKINNALGLAGYNNSNFRVRVYQIVVQSSKETKLWAENSDFSKAFDSAILNGADVINHSWGFTCGYYDGIIADAFRLAHDYGILNVAASGKCNGTQGCDCVWFPASLPNVLAVGGITQVGAHWDNASFGPEIDVAGYAEGIVSLDQMGLPGYSYPPSASTGGSCVTDSDDYGCYDGTSLAAPQATAIAGLVLAKRPDLKNKPDTLAKILKYSTDDGAAPCTLDTVRHDDEIGYGRLDAYRALYSVSRGNVNNAGIIDLADLSYMVNYLTGSGPAPLPDPYIGDLNCDCIVDLSDLSRLVAFVTQGSPPIPLCFRFHS